MNSKETCPSYIGPACVDGTCPIANRDEYIERDYFVVWSCGECHFYEGCKDCYFAFCNQELCPKNEKTGY